MSVAEAAAPPSTALEFVNSLGFVLLLLCVAVAPFPYGGVLPGGTMTIEVLAFLATAMALASWPLRVGIGAAGLPVMAIAGIAILGVIQLLPVQPQTLRAISPWSAHIDDETNALLRLSGRAPVPYRISIAPTETESTALLTLAYVALFLSAAILTDTRRRRRIIVAALFATSLGHLFVTAAMAGTERIHGAFVNPNHFAGYLLIPLAFALGLIWTEILTGADRVRGIRDRAEKLERRLLPFVWRVLLWGVIAAGIALTRSRGAVLAAVFATLMMIAAGLLHRPMSDRGRRLAAGLTMAILLGIVFVVFTTGEASILRFLAADPREIRTDTRTQIWRTSIQAWEMFPTFGSGLGTFREAFRRVQPRGLEGLVEQAHSDPLQLLVTGGWIGVTLAAIAFASIFVLLFTRWLQQSHREEAAMALAGMGALVALAVHGIVEFNMSIPAIVATLAAMLGAAWTSSRA